ADRPRDVCAVTVAVVGVLSVANGIEADQRATAELRVRAPNAGVDDVRVHAGAGRRVRVDPIERQVALSDAIEAPRRIVLRHERLDHRIFFDEPDAAVVTEARGLLLRHERREPMYR